MDAVLERRTLFLEQLTLSLQTLNGFKAAMEVRGDPTPRNVPSRTAFGMYARSAFRSELSLDQGNDRPHFAHDQATARIPMALPDPVTCCLLPAACALCAVRRVLCSDSDDIPAERYSAHGV
jgi:hypothetical protein